jgi:hypothetical protein
VLTVELERRYKKRIGDQSLNSPKVNQPCGSFSGVE